MTEKNGDKIPTISINNRAKSANKKIDCKDRSLLMQKVYSKDKQNSSGGIEENNKYTQVS